MSDARSDRVLMMLLEPQHDPAIAASTGPQAPQSGLPGLDQRVEMFIAAVHGAQVVTPEARAAARAHILAAMASDLAERSLHPAPLAAEAPAAVAEPAVAGSAEPRPGILGRLAAAMREATTAAAIRGMRLAAVPLVALLAAGALWSSRSIFFGPVPQQTSRLPEAATEVAPESPAMTRSLAPSPEAEAALRNRIFSAESALGPNHPDVAATMISLAALYRSQGRHVEAEALYERALAIRERALGPNHPDVAMTLNELAQVYRIRGRTREAQELSDRAAAIPNGTNR